MGAYEDVNRKLGASVQQYDVTIKKLTELDVSYKKMTADYNKSLTVIKDYELKLNGFNGKVNELTTANNQLVMVKTNLEKEFGQVSKDYDDIARELKLADDRANKAGSDAHHFESLLREEQAKLVKIDQAKKSLENEVRSLSVRIEEIETNSVATSKRTIQKMEVRIEELEVMINNEKKSHAATMTELHTKTRSIKELIPQSEEDRKNIIILQDSLDKLNEKIKMYKRQLEEQESISNSNIMRVKKFQRELESAESRAEEAESTLNQFRSRERVFAAASARSEKVQDVEERGCCQEDRQQGQYFLRGGCQFRHHFFLRRRQLQPGRRVVILRLEQLQGRICCLQQSRIRGSRRIHLQSFQHGQSRLHEQSRLRPQILSYLFSKFYLERLEPEWQIVEKGRYKGRPLIHVCGEKNTKQTTFYIAMIPQLIFCTNQSQ